MLLLHLHSKATLGQLFLVCRMNGKQILEGKNPRHMVAIQGIGGTRNRWEVVAFLIFLYTTGTVMLPARSVFLASCLTAVLLDVNPLIHVQPFQEEGLQIVAELVAENRLMACHKDQFLLAAHVADHRRSSVPVP